MSGWLQCFLFGHEWEESWLFPFISGLRCDICGKEKPFATLPKIRQDNDQ